MEKINFAMANVGHRMKWIIVVTLLLRMSAT